MEARGGGGVSTPRAHPLVEKFFCFEHHLSVVLFFVFCFSLSFFLFSPPRALLLGGLLFGRLCVKTRTAAVPPKRE